MTSPKTEFRCVYGVLLAAFCLVLATPRASHAHPMGNFSISHYSGIHIEAVGVELRYILDMAEIPTFQIIQETGIVAKAGDPSTEAYLAREAEILKAGLVLEVNGQPVALEIVSHDVLFTPGAGGLPTMKIGFVYHAAFPAGGATGASSLAYRDSNFAGRAGWKEVVATGDPDVAFQSSSAPASSRSQQLANYPTDLLNSPPQDLEAHVSFSVLGSATIAAAIASSEPVNSKSHARVSSIQRRPAGKVARVPVRAFHGVDGSPARALPEVRSPAAALRLEPNQQPTPRNRFTQLITSEQWGFWFLLSAALIAAALGGLHALEPGHGKTIVAAYLVGERGTAMHAFLLGLIVTATHTAGVYALGLITLYASRYIVPDQLYPWLGLVSGLTIAGLGFYMLLRRSAAHTHGHSHSADHDHDHGHSHTHVHPYGHDHQDAHGHDHRDHTHAHGYSHKPPTDEHARPARDEHLHSHGFGFTHSHVPARAADGSISYRQLLALGVTGGIVPCPAALVVLLSAVSLHRIGFGLFLIVAFSLGLAAVLISIGLLTVCAQRFITRWKTNGPLMNRWLPMASAAVITVLGMAIAVKALMTAGIVQIRL